MNVMSFSGAGQTALSGSGVLAVRSYQVRVTRLSAAEFRIITPVQNAPDLAMVTEYHLKKNGTTWSVLGCYARDFSTGLDIQLSETSDTSAWEYAFQVGVADAPQNTFDYIGVIHGHETLLTLSILVDGVDVSALATGTAVQGATCIVYQTHDMRLPRNADNSVNDVTVCGSGTLRHTFSSAGMLIEHTHIMSAGYQGVTCYAAQQPGHLTNLNRFQVNALPVRTPTQSGATIDYGVQATTYSAWHATAHQYRLNMSLPSGGPDINGDWQYAGPDYGFFLDDASRKFRICYQGSAYAAWPTGNRRNTGSTSHKTLHTVSWV